MPHTSHRPRHRPNTRPRRTQTTDANGWTTIQHGPKVPPPPNPPLLQLPSPSPDSHAHAHNHAPSPSDLQALATHYAQQRHLWATSACAARLRAIVAERVQRDEIPDVGNCVVLGLGSLCAGSAPGAARKSLVQLAALEEMVECLSSRFPELRDTIYAQDPAFSATDVAFLATRGVKVLEVPGASERVGRGTVLYAPHCSRPAYLDALGTGLGKRGGGTVGGGDGERGNEEEDGDGEEGGPALVVGNEVGELIDGTIETPVSMMRMGKAFLDVDGRRSVAFPRFEPDETVFWNMCLYWRERGVGEDTRNESMEQV